MKRVLGYLFFVLAIFLGISVLVQIPTIFEGVSTATSNEYSFGFVLGKFIAMLIFLIIILLLIRIGKKWTTKRKSAKEIQGIGKEVVKNKKE